MRRRLFAAVSITALLSAPAFAQEAEVTVDDEREEPVETATANEGSPANLIIGTNGRVTLVNVSGPAVRVNSDNTLTTQPGSVISITDQNADGENQLLTDAVGVAVDSGVTTEIEHSGRIELNDTYAPTASDTDTDLVDTDGDGEVDSPDTEADGAFAEDLRKIGLLIGDLNDDFTPVEGQDAVTGSVNLLGGSSIAVEGQNSYGLRVASDLDGDILASGLISIVGEDSTALSIEGDVSGDIQVSRILAITPRGNGVSVGGDVDGGVRFSNLVTVSGYRVDQRLLADLMRRFDVDDDDIDSGSAVIIAGSVSNGIFVSGAADLRVLSGSGAALDIGRGGETITIGTTVVPDDFGQATADADEDEDPDTTNYAIVNEGALSAQGIFDGKSATAFLIGGYDENGQLRTVILSGDGMRNDGQITALSYDANATGLRFGAGTQAEGFENFGAIFATSRVGYEDDGFADESYANNIAAYAVVLDEGSEIRQLLNGGGASIVSSVELGGSGAGATAIRVDSEALETIHNQGTITTQTLVNDPDAVDGGLDLIAIDARNHNAGLTVTQSREVDEEGEPTAVVPVITGDILFGSGADTLELLSGEVNGDVFFGLGSDRLIINGAELSGAINDEDGDLTIEVTDGRIVLSGEQSVALTDAIFNEGGRLDIEINTADRTGAFIDATGAVTFAEGSDLSVSLGGLIEDVQDFQLISSSSLTIADDTILTATEAPFLYNAEIATADGDPNTLILSLSRKTANELGMNANEAAAYDEAFAAMTAINELGNAFAAVRTADEFFGAYNQLLPEYASSAIQFALASNDAAAGALSTRLRNARLSPDELAGIWIQEFGYFADRNSTSFGPGYRGQGVGVAMGIDRPVGPFYAVGVHLIGAASEVEEIDGFDEPMVAISGQLGGYAAMDMGGFDVSGSVGLGYDYFETERNIIIDSFATVNTAEWTGWHLTASAQAGRDYQVGNWTLRPEASVTWLSLFESGYTEQNEDPDFAGLALIVDDRESSVMTAGATFSVGRRFGTDLSWWSPTLRFGYRGELLGSETDTVAQFGSDGSPFTLQSQTLPGSGILGGFGLSAGSQYTTFTFAYDADVREDFIRHVARLVVRMTF